MCGIAGVVGKVSKPEAEGIAQLMVSALKHRGPNDQGVLSVAAIANTVALGNTRLSILDLSEAGHQPMTDDSERYTIVFNGEIYNFPELRKLLDASNHLFRSSSDTEAVLLAFRRWSVKAFGMLRGMFALAILDRLEQVLYLVRDPLGIKPLYYYAEDNCFLFASEVRALLATGRVPRRIHSPAIDHFLHYGWVGESETLIAGVKLLQPGQMLAVDFSGEQLSWSTSAFEHEACLEPIRVEPERNESIAHLRHLLEESVKSHLLSDVPVGLFLSGGLDSTALLHLMSRAGDRANTFTIVFPESDFSEGYFARRVAQQYGADHHEIELTESGLLSEMPYALSAMDQPTMDGINSFVVSKAVSDSGTKVALSGLGGDELFAGYPSFRRARLARTIAAVPSGIRDTFAAICRMVLASPRLEKHWDLLSSDCTPASVYELSRRLFSRDVAGALLPDSPRHETLTSSTPSGDEINDISQLETRGYMTNLLLRDTDFMSMANSLEVRVPFVDKVVIRYANRMSGDWKLQNRPKAMLREVMRGELPDYVWNRRKMGFVLPFTRWMRMSLRKTIEDTFRNQPLIQSVGLSQEAVLDVWNGFLRGQIRWSHPWSLFVLLLWCERYQVSI
jgi:asparagine synthase (glutamine-hydrolysing)